MRWGRDLCRVRRWGTAEREQILVELEPDFVFILLRMVTYLGPLRGSAGKSSITFTGFGGVVGLLGTSHLQWRSTKSGRRNRPTRGLTRTTRGRTYKYLHCIDPVVLPSWSLDNETTHRTTLPVMHSGDKPHSLQTATSDSRPSLVEGWSGNEHGGMVGALAGNGHHDYTWQKVLLLSHQLNPEPGTPFAVYRRNRAEFCVLTETSKRPVSSSWGTYTDQSDSQVLEI